MVEVTAVGDAVVEMAAVEVTLALASLKSQPQSSMRSATSKSMISEDASWEGQ